MQFFSIFSTVNPFVSLLPLLAVLGISAAKDGYEDVKRHQSDRRVNQSQVRVLVGGAWQNSNAAAGKRRTFVRGLVPQVRRKKESAVGAAQVEVQARAAPPEAVYAGAVGHDHDEREYDDNDNDDDLGSTHAGVREHDMEGRPHWRKTSWEDVRVGDIVKVHDGDALPADILLCASSGPDGIAYVETKNLDGETSLKSRVSVPALTHLNSARKCADQTTAFTVECDRPDSNMYRLSAAVATKESEKVAVELQNTLLRGTVLRNTQWVIGVVLFTGEDTKVVLNSGNTPSKWSRVERQMNPQV
jgi:phospholipid-translocating ATPase